MVNFSVSINMLCPFRIRIRMFSVPLGLSEEATNLSGLSEEATNLSGLSEEATNLGGLSNETV